MFITIRLQEEYTISAGTGTELLEFLIDALIPIFPCVTAASLAGLLISFLSVYNLFYVYKRIMIQIREEGRESPILKHAWKFKAYNSLYFCTQFVTNTLVLNNLFMFCLFIPLYILSISWMQKVLWWYVKSRPAGFWVGFTPVIIG